MNRKFILEKIISCLEKEFKLFSIYPKYKDIKDPAKIRTFFGSSRRTYHAPFNIISEYIQANCNLDDQQIVQVQQLVKALQNSIEKYISVSHKEFLAKIPYDIHKFGNLEKIVNDDMNKLIDYVKPIITVAINL